MQACLLHWLNREKALSIYSLLVAKMPQVFCINAYWCLLQIFAPQQSFFLQQRSQCPHQTITTPNDMQPNHAIDHSKSKIQEFSEQLSAANPFCAKGCLGQVSPGGRFMGGEGKGGQVWSVQPTCLKAGPKVCYCSCSPLLLPPTAVCHKATSFQSC